MLKTYDVDAIPSLVATLRDLFEKYPRMTALIAATVRNKTTFEAFINACSKSSGVSRLLLTYSSPVFTKLVFSGVNDFSYRDVDFASPPLDQQTGFFHPTTTQIRILSITRSKTSVNTRV